MFLLILNTCSGVELLGSKELCVTFSGAVILSKAAPFYSPVGSMSVSVSPYP